MKHVENKFESPVRVGDVWRHTETNKLWKIDGIHLNTMKQAMIEVRLFEHLEEKVITSDLLYKQFKPEIPSRRMSNVS